MNKTIEITNPDRIIFKADKITKLQVVEYYNSVAEFMFPYLQDRLLSVIRCHGDSLGEKFFKKHPAQKSEFIKTHKVNGEEYYYLKTPSGIVYEAQMGTLEFHTWASDVKNFNKPNIMTFDLDPDESINLKQLRQGVLHLKSLLDELGLVSFLKTSGGKGYHICIPFEPSCTWKKFYAFSEQVATLMEQKWSDKYTTNIRKSERKGKIFIDYMRNNKGSTCVAPFSLRAREHPCVSMPIAWEELNKIAPNKITMFDALKRIKNHNPWKDFFNVKQKIN